MSWRLAKSLIKLREQVNALAPGRSIRDDGTIGNREHAIRKSDHNPNRKGVVRAFDITHDPAGGMDSYKLAETLRQSRDPRIINVISAGKIFSSETKPYYQWRPYNGKNAHRQHVHVGVLDIESLYDDAHMWQLGGGPIIVAPTAATPPTLWLTSKGEAVRDLQRRLRLEVDGDFGKATDRAVRAFQKARGLTVDGVVGVNTWLALLAEAPIPAVSPSKLIPKQFGIVATMFGGVKDNERSAYDNKLLNDTDLYVALPFRFKKPPLIKVTNPKNGKFVIGLDRDVGPHNVDDDYWNRGVRPQAESGRCVRGPNKGRKTNLAGIDLSPALAKAIGITGDPKTDRVDWEEVRA